MRPRPGSRDSGTGTVPDPFSAAQLEYEAGPGRTVVLQLWPMAAGSLKRS